MKTPTILMVCLLSALALEAQEQEKPEKAQPPALAAQQTSAPGPSQPPSTEDRLKALEDRILELEGEIRDLKSNQASAAGPAASGSAQPESSLVAQPASLGGAAGQSKALNPDISLIGDFLAGAGHNSVNPSRAIEMHETELGIQAVVDPYARADVFLSFGEEGVNLEEGYLTFTSLPAGLVAKVGKMRSAFGKVNTMHNHVLPWADRPLVTGNLVGGEDGIDDAGFSISHIIPAPGGLFLEATGQVFRGDSADVFHSSQRSDLSAVAHLKSYKDLSESTNLEIGLSYARGHNDAGIFFFPLLVPRSTDFVTQLYGVDATVRWKPLRRAIYHSFIARSEFIWSQRQQFPFTQRAFGYYTSADYQFARRWLVGGRYDWSDRARFAGLHDQGGSAILTYRPSEFAQLRAQYRFTDYALASNASELLLQVQFALGAHGAHPF